MRHLKILLAIMIIISLSFLSATFVLPQLRGQRAPDFVTSTIDGKRFALKDYLQRTDHRVLILAFFATWCELCDEDFKFFQRLQDQYGDQGLRVFCIFTGSRSRIKAAKEYLESLKVELPVLLNEMRGITKRYKVAGFPCTYAIDKEGFMRIKYLGCSEDVKTKFEENLKNLLTISG
jgi:peroxiredoxin